MAQRGHVLVVARSLRVVERLLAWLDDSGFETTLVATFGDAKAHLEQRPDLVVTEVKLGEYNGLHLALKADAAGIPAVVVGPDDPVLRNDAAAIRALYLSTLTRTALIDAVTALLAPRKGATVPFTARVTTIAAEAELMWRAFSESPSSELSAFGRTILPN